jgi:diguanylate cyclase (GGDEF)-like protein/PAS domain S-box-containing protein
VPPVSGGGYQNSLGEEGPAPETAEARRSEVSAIRAAFLSLEDGVVIFDRGGAVLAANPAAAQIMGVPLDEMLGRSPQQAPEVDARFHHGPAITRENSTALRVLRTGKPERGLVVEFRDPTTGAVRLIRVNVHPLIDPGETRPWGVVGSFVDMTERERALSELAFKDSLTGLPNRRVLEQHLELAIARAKRSGQGLALLFLDVDNLKEINDRLGHSAGDTVLKEIAARLSRITRSTDLLARQGTAEQVVGRLGGDEFLLLLADLQHDVPHILRLVTERVQECMAEPFALGSDQVTMSISLGVAAYPEDGSVPAELLTHADHEMYAAKRGRQAE